MKWQFVIGVVATVASVQLASAQNFPRHDEICAGGIVTKARLAKAFLQTEEGWLKLYLDSVESPGGLQKEPRWRLIFTDPEKFCAGNAACLSPDNDVTPPVRNANATIKSLRELQRIFAGALQTNTRPGQSYSIANRDIGVGYFLGPDNQNPIQCLAGESPLASKPPKPPKMPFRLRANADDLSIDAATQKAAFKGVAPASINFTRDGVAQKTNTTKLKATLGYPIDLGALPLPLVKPQALSSLSGELIPYISASQSISKVDGKPKTFAETNNVAAGALLSTDMTFDQMPGVDHFVLAKPQYLWNTKDKSEIASLKVMYQPWTTGRPSINTPFPVTTVDGAWVQLLFDLRWDSGIYTNKGDDPAKIAQHTSFERGGSKFGIVVTTPALGPHVTLSATQTLLYGFSGDIRYLSLFEAMVHFYLDSTNNFAFTVGYTKGRDEDTAEKAQTFTAGFSAKF